MGHAKSREPSICGGFQRTRAWQRSPKRASVRASRREGKASFVPCFETSSVPHREHTNKEKVKIHKRISQESAAVKENDKELPLFGTVSTKTISTNKPFQCQEGLSSRVGQEMLRRCLPWQRHFWKQFLEASAGALCWVRGCGRHRS